MTDELFKLAADWFRYCVAPGVSEDKPGIYEWRIEGIGCYIGKYSRISRPKKEYGRNVVRLLNNLPYRKSKPDDYRRIHRELAKAVNARLHVELLILKNVEPPQLNVEERALIEERRRAAAAGGLCVLNSDVQFRLR